MGTIRLLGTQQQDQWLEVLKRSAQHDFYHLPQYHALAERRNEGSAKLLVFEERDYLVALPLLLRPIEEGEALTSDSCRYSDATSVYGYAGPVSSAADLPPTVLADLHGQLRETLHSLGVVAVFSRLHPLFPQRPLLEGLGQIQSPGQTISIDLGLPVAAQRAQFRKNHKEGINRLRRSGVQCIEDTDRRYLSDFINLYHETMIRVGADARYLFDRDYFESLLGSMPQVFHLFVALLNGEVVGGGLFAEACGIVQYHLGGTRNDSLRIAPMKLIVDTVRLWATERGLQVFHLGGGVDSRADSLFAFKAGFSNRRHQFSTWRWIVMPEIYDELCQERERGCSSFDRHAVRSTKDRVHAAGR